MSNLLLGSKIHITCTGLYAGKTFCGASRDEGSRYLHLGNWIHNPDLEKDICKECLKAYEEATKDE